MISNLILVADYIILICWNTIFCSKNFLDANDDIYSKQLNRMFWNMEKFLAQLMQ